MILLVFPLAHVAFSLWLSVFQCLFWYRRRRPEISVSLWLHNSDTRYCWGFPLFTKQTRFALHVSQYTIVSLQMRTESFLPSHGLSTRWILVPSDREHTARRTWPERAENLLLSKREVFLTWCKWLWGYFNATNKSFNLAVLMQGYFFLTGCFPFNFQH